MTLPEVFNGGVIVKQAHGGGAVRVDRRSVVLTPGPLTRRATGVELVVHRSDRIDLFKARLAWPLFASTSLVVDDGEVVTLAIVANWSRRRLQKALVDAGLTVDEHTTWFYRGADRVT